MKILSVLIVLVILTGCNEKVETSNDFKIIDNTEICAEALEEIYRDDSYIYYLSCIKSDNIIIEFDDNTKYKLREVLENNILSIDELIDNGLEVYKDEIIIE